MNAADRHDARILSAVEREAIAGALSSSRLEADRQRRAIERELGAGLARQCHGCGQWVSLFQWQDEVALCPGCRTDLQGTNR